MSRASMNCLSHTIRNLNYLYHDPASGQLTWISWDHNMAMMSRGMAGPGARGPGDRDVSLDRAEVNDNWPLVRYLLDDPVNYARYLGYLEETIDEPFNPDHMAEAYQAWADLIEPFAVADVGEDAFHAAVQALIDHAYERADAVEAFLSASSGMSTP